MGMGREEHFEGTITGVENPAPKKGFYFKIGGRCG